MVPFPFSHTVAGGAARRGVGCAQRAGEKGRGAK